MGKSETHYKTRLVDRVHPARKVAYGGGMVNYALLVVGYAQLVNPIFNVNLGVSPIAIGLIMGLSRVWDAVTDPLMGTISDNTRSIYGRRRPWILLGSIAVALTFVLIWWFPLGKSQTFYISYLSVTTVLFYAGFTMFSVPYLALGMEMSPDYHERTRIVAYRDFLQPFGAFAAQALFWLATLNVFSDVFEGLRFTSLGVGLIVILLGVIASVFPREHPSVELLSASQKKVSFIKSICQTLKVKPFLIICISTAVALVGVTMVGHLGFYVCLYYLFGGDQSACAEIFALWGFAMQFASLLMVPVIVRISTKIGKRKTLLIFFGVSIIGSLSKWWLIIPGCPYLSLIPQALMGMGFIASSTMMNSMIPDAVDYDELTTKTRREGMFGAVYGWSWKLGIALALVLSGFVLPLTGYDAALPAQSSSTITWIRLAESGLPVFGYIGAVCLVWFYPLSEQTAYKVREELERRRAN